MGVPRWRVRRIPTAMTFALVCAATSLGCSRRVPSSDRTSNPMPKEQDLVTLAREVGLTFPAGTRLVGVKRESGMDDLVAFKVELPSKALTAFLKSTPVKEEDFAGGERGLLGPDDGWWDPGRAPRLRTGQAMLPGARALNIGVDDSRPKVAVLYIVNHGT